MRLEDRWAWVTFYGPGRPYAWRWYAGGYYVGVCYSAIRWGWRR